MELLTFMSLYNLYQAHKWINNSQDIAIAIMLIVSPSPVSIYVAVCRGKYSDECKVHNIYLFSYLFIDWLAAVAYTQKCE